MTLLHQVFILCNFGLKKVLRNFHFTIFVNSILCQFIERTILHLLGNNIVVNRDTRSNAIRIDTFVIIVLIGRFCKNIWIVIRLWCYFLSLRSLLLNLSLLNGLLHNFILLIFLILLLVLVVILNLLFLLLLQIRSHFVKVLFHASLNNKFLIPI